MSFHSVGNMFRRLPIRRSFFRLSNSNLSPIKRQHLFPLLGIVGVGTGLYLCGQTLQAPAYCADGRSAIPRGPPVKIINHVSEIRDSNNYNWKYVILGCGTAAFAAVRAISENEPGADILVVSPLEKIPELKDIKIRSDDFKLSYTEWRRHVVASVPSHYGSHISPLTKLVVLTGNGHYHIDKEEKKIFLVDGSVVNYQNVCIATTGEARKFRFTNKKNKRLYGGESVSSRVNELTDITAFEKLQKDIDIVDPRTNKLFHESIVVVGGGFLGTEVALGCLAEGRKVYQLYAEDCLMDRYLPTYLALYTRALLQKAGITCLPNTLVTDVELERNKSLDLGGGLQYNRVKINLANDFPILSSYVTLASTRIQTDIINAKDSGLPIDPITGGIEVDTHLEVANNIFVAGNSASWTDVSGRRRRVNRYDHTKKSGHVAGHNMSCHTKERMVDYKYEPGFRSVLPQVGVEINAVGDIDSNLKTVGVWATNLQDPAGENTNSLKQGIVYYMDGSTIVGCLLWNNPHLSSKARKLLGSKEARQIENVMDLKKKIELGPTDLLNIMVEKKNVGTINEILSAKKEEAKQK